MAQIASSNLLAKLTEVLVSAMVGNGLSAIRDGFVMGGDNCDLVRVVEVEVAQGCSRSTGRARMVKGPGLLTVELLI